MSVPELQQAQQLLQQGALQQAQHILQDFCRRNPANIEGLFLFSMACQERRLFEQAKQLLLQILSLQENTSALFNLALIHLNENQYAQAIHYLQRARKCEPQSTDIGINLGLAYKNNGDYDEAIQLFRDMLVGFPQMEILHVHLATVLRQTGEYDAAMQHIDKLLSLNPRLYTPLHTRGNIHKDRGELRAAIRDYDAALGLKADAYDALISKAHALLMLQDYPQGWRLFEMRKRREPQDYSRYPDITDWDGGSFDGCLLVIGEQGLGEEIMFASCLHEVRERVQTCIVLCQKKLVPIFAASFSDCVILQHGADITPHLRGRTKKIYIGSLPGLLQRDFTQQRNPHSWLHIDHSSIAAWQQRLQALGPGLKVGIAWQGGTPKTLGQLRSVTLQQLQPLLQLDGIDFISLQYTDCRNELATFKQQTGITIHHWQDAIDAYQQTAALITSLDLVISIQTAAAHLAGALGIETWVMTCSAPDWPYLHEGRTMPWYPAAILYRQRQPHDWGEVIQQITSDLQQRLARQ